VDAIFGLGKLALGPKKRSRRCENGRQYLMVPTRSNQMRRKSMQGTLLFVLGIIGAIVFVVNGSIWVAGASVVLLVTAVLLLYQVGKSLP
jgi:hypothetical protein